MTLHVYQSVSCGGRECNGASQYFTSGSIKPYRIISSNKNIWFVETVMSDQILHVIFP